MKDRGRLWAFLFLTSLALNLFLGGMLTMRWVGHHGEGLGRRASMAQVRRAAGPDAQPAIDRVWAKHEKEVRGRAKEASEARQKAMAALGEKNFDRAAADRDLAEFRAKLAASQAAMHETLLEVAAELTPEQRAAMGKGLHAKGMRGED